MGDKKLGGWEFLLPLLPEKLRPYAKAIISSLPAFAYLITAFVNELVEMGLTVPAWLALLVAMLTTLAVYETPNEDVQDDE